MAVSSSLASLLFLVSGFLKRIFQDGGAQALALKRWIYRRLSGCWSTYSLNHCSTVRKEGASDSSSPPSTLEGDFEKLIGESDGKLPRNSEIDEEFKYTRIINGEVIPMDDRVLPSSVYPLSGEGIRSVHGSATSLRLSHSRAVSIRSARFNATSTHGSVKEGDDTRSRGSAAPSINYSFSDAEDNNSNRSGITLNVIGPDNQTAQETSTFPVSGAPEPGNQYPTGFLDLNPRHSRAPSLSGRLPPPPNLLPSNVDPSHAVPLTPPPGNHALSTTNGPALTNLEPPPSPDVDHSSYESYAPASSYPFDSGVYVAPQIDTRTNGRIPFQVDAVRFPVPQEHLPFIGTNPRLCLETWDALPAMPQKASDCRYTYRPTIPSDAATEEQAPISPWTTHFGKQDPEGWKALLHPEGACYFVNRTKRIYTDANMYDHSKLALVNNVIHRIEHLTRNSKIFSNDANVELVLWLIPPAEPNGEMLVHYYCVHHLSRSIFFLEECLPKEYLPAFEEILGGPTSHAHLGHEIEAQYWYHCQLFPHSPRLTTEIIQELRGVVVHYIADTSTSPKASTAPYPLEDLYKILTLISEAERITSSENDYKTVSAGRAGAHSCIARIMFVFTRARFLHFHGEPHARLDRTVSVYDDNPPRRTLLVKSFSWMLFYAPDFHLENLQSMWVDRISHKAVFQEAMGRMNEEWDQYTLLSTVVIAADFALWSVPNFTDTDSNNRSAAQIASHLSAIASVGSLVIGLLLTRQNRTKMRQTVDDFENYMSARSHPRLGLETLAILNSLPYALLMWAMVSLSIALLLFCFMHSDIRTRVLTGVSSLCCGLLIAWCVVNNWEKKDKEGEPSPVPQPTAASPRMPYEQHTNGYNLQTFGNTTQYPQVIGGQRANFYQQA